MNLIKIHFVHNVLSMKNHASKFFFSQMTHLWLMHFLKNLNIYCALNEKKNLAMRNLKQDMIIFNQIKGMSK